MNIPTIFTQVEFFYSLACYTVILSGTFCAIVRWCHMCHPFDKQGDYFYPARRQMTFFYAATALQLPYVLCPADPGTWFFARSFGILYYPVCFAMLYHRYFQMGKMWRKVSSIFYFLTPFLLLGGLFTIVVFHAEEILLPYKLQWECVVGGMSILLSIRMTRVGRWLIRKVDEYHTQNFSSDSDFPLAFAKKILYLPVMWLLVMWTQFLVDSQLLKAFIDLLLAAWQIRFLCRILHPNKLIHSAQGQEGMDTIAQDNMERVLKETEFFEQIVQAVDYQAGGVTDIEDADDEPELQERNRENSRLQIKQENWESVKNEVLTIVSRRYLEPSLKRIEVVRDVSSKNHTLAGTFITQVGFYRLVNAFPHPSLRKADGIRLFCQHRTGSRCRAVRFQEQMGTHQCQKATQRLRLRPDREVCELNFLPFYSTFALLNFRK